MVLPFMMLKKSLAKELKRNSNNNPFVDLFINTHPHQDHCLGFEKNFYCGSPNDYKDTHRKTGYPAETLLYCYTEYHREVTEFHRGQ